MIVTRKAEDPRETSSDVGASSVPTVWDERYHCPEAGGLASTVKQKQVVDRGNENGWLRISGHESFDAATTWAQIGAVHDESYVEAVRTGEPKELAQSQGFRWAPEFPESVARIWSGHVEACRLALEEGLVFHPVSGAHHARRATGGGFCTFNYLVGAPRTLFEEGWLERVMVVDLDTHQGNGTWELVEDDARFSIFDFSGAEFGVPEVEAEGRFSRLVRDAETYFELLAKLPAFIDGVRPELIQFQAGMDCHEDDGVGGVPGLSGERLEERDAFVFETARSRGVPVVFNLAGGYQGEFTVALHLNTVRVALRVESPRLDHL